MSKKVIGALLAIALVLSVFSFSVFAAGTGYDNDPSHTQTWGLANKTGSGGTYTVDVLLTTTYEVGPIQFKIEGVEKVTKVEVGSDYYAATAHAGSTGLISLIPNTDGAAVPVKKLSKALIAKVTYTSSENATPSIKDDVKSASNPQGTLMAAFADGNGYLSGSDFLVGQKATFVALGEEWPEVSTEAADLAKTASAEAGVLIDKTHTFGGAYTGVVFGFTQSASNIFSTDAYLTKNLEATNGGSLAFSRSIGNMGYGTGTVITVKNADGTEAAKYVVVIFGDVDGNGLTNVNDTKATQKAAKNATVYAENSVQRMAANCQNVAAEKIMHDLNVNDTKAVQANAKGTRVDQAALASRMASNKTYYK